MRMKSPLAALIMAAALLVPPVARASDQPAWSVSLLGGYSQFSDKLFYPSDSLADAPVAGFRFGRAFGNWWTLEGTASYASTHGLKRNGVDGPDVVLLNGSGSLVAQITPPNQLGALYLSGGFGDGLDQCPDTPKGATVDAKGCPMDSDGDGVLDGLDQCANTPKGATVDTKGCPMDTDGDGVPDGLDKCPDTAAGLKVDASGCPIEVKEKETELLDTGTIRLQNVNFDTGKAILLPESYGALDEVGAILLKWPQLLIEIGGHTDSRGTAIKNQGLSENRAPAGKDYPVAKFPPPLAGQPGVQCYGCSPLLARPTTRPNTAQ